VASSAQPVVYLGPTEPICLEMSDDNPGQLTMTTGGSGGAVTSVNGETGAVTTSQSGEILAINSYQPGTNTTLSVSTAAYAAWSSANVNTGSFIAPPSGSVLVTVSAVILQTTATSVVGLALAAHGTVSPLVCPAYQFSVPNNSGHAPTTIPFLVTELAPGNTYNFDVLGATITPADVLEMFAGAPTNTTIQAGAFAAPVTVITQAI